MTNASCHDMEIALLVIHARLFSKFYAFFLNLSKVANH